MTRWAIDIDRDDITQAVVSDAPEQPLAEGEIEVAVELFAMTANNVTYAALGKPMGFLGPDAGYWDFFGDRGAPGRLPVWGFARVTRSTVPGLAEGEELYGYWPLASHAVLRPERVGAVGFVDAMPRRQALPAFYNRYQRVSALDDYDVADRDYWPVFRPLYLTGWLIADQLFDEQENLAQVIATAASSKTALGFAHAMREQTKRPLLIGLTSPGSAAFVAETGLYDRVVTYDAVGEIAIGGETALIDFAGNPAVAAEVAARLDESLTFAMGVGKTHWEATGEGPRMAFFFAPARIEKRGAEWGGDAFRAAIGESWGRFMRDVRDLTRLDRREGADGALVAYREAVTGTADPRASVIVAGLA
ncbi:DUF2855 family protein [Sphingomonas sp. SUN019]|uniref:DUF2855 family protein n=1 Tax=Sphingomonas sp. SUN019 TaxID=2937788 RepID=UPI0021644684|nr:DUF2855 family protein [Sphingomonas sp. SUN019]UVO52332.1 DUF2855 family protein [Sphingomonas sp. SUN019]